MKREPLDVRPADDPYPEQDVHVADSLVREWVIAIAPIDTLSIPI